MSFENTTPILYLGKQLLTLLEILYYFKIFLFNSFRNDEKLVLTCMGALNDDSSVVLWSSEKHDVSISMFFSTLNSLRYIVIL